MGDEHDKFMSGLLDQNSATNPPDVRIFEKLFLDSHDYLQMGFCLFMQMQLVFKGAIKNDYI